VTLQISNRSWIACYSTAGLFALLPPSFLSFTFFYPSSLYCGGEIRGRICEPDRFRGMAGGLHREKQTARQTSHHYNHDRRIGQLRKQVVDSYPETQLLKAENACKLARINRIFCGPSGSLRRNSNTRSWLHCL
jgi:hypothetical protein